MIEPVPMKQHLRILLFAMILLAGCNNPRSNNNPFGSESDNNELNAPPPPDGSEYSEGEMEGDGGPNLSSSSIRWKDGNTYSYDYTEIINYIDTLNETHQVTVYRSNRPNDVNCDIKTCKWCSKQYGAVDYTLEEYPNISWMTKRKDEMSYSEAIEAASALVDMGKRIFNQENSYYDLENFQVRVEWRTTCHYNNLEFCSLKCESEYKNRE